MRARQGLWSVLVLGSLAACGGGDGSGTGSGGGGGGTGPLIEGGVVKGPVSNATVCVYAVSNGAKGARIDLTGTGVVNGCFVTQPDGLYRLQLPAGTDGDVIIESTGGQYCSDEQPVAAGACAAGATLESLAGQVMVTAATLPASGPVQVYATPLTSAAALNTMAAGAFTTAAFLSGFDTLVGQVVGVGSSLTPATVPNAANSPFLGALANFLQNNGGSWQQMMASLQTGVVPTIPSVPGGGGGPVDPPGGSTGLAGPFDFSGSPSNEQIMQIMVGEYDVAIMAAPSAAETGMGKLAVAYPGGDGPVSITLKDASGNVLLSRSAPALSDNSCGDGRCRNLWDNAVGYAEGGRRFGIYNYYEAGNSTGPGAYAQVSFITTGHLMGSIGTYSFRNGLPAFGSAVPAQFATLAGSYAGTEQTLLCGAGSPVLVDITAGGSIRIQGKSALTCVQQDVTVQWDGQNDFISVEPSGEVVLKLDSQNIGGSQPGGGITIKLPTAQSPAGFSEANLSMAGAAGGVTTVNATRL
jgi:hypothetical protein